MNSFVHRMRSVGNNNESETNLAGDEMTSHVTNRFYPAERIVVREFGVQTDDDLLNQIIPSVRRRALNSDSSGSTRSQESSGKTSRSQDGCNRGRHRKSSKSSSASKNSYHSSTGGLEYAFPTASSALSTPKHRYDSSHHDMHYSNSTDKLLSAADHRLEQHNRAFSPHHLGLGDKSPLLGSGEHSPLLSGDERFACDSTSEETLSEHETEDQLDDIEDLLTGAGSQADSFESSHLDILSPEGGFPEFPDYGPPASHVRRTQFHDSRDTTLTSVETATTDVDHVISYLDDEEEHEWGRTMDTYRAHKRPQDTPTYHPHSHGHRGATEPGYFRPSNNTDHGMRKESRHYGPHSHGDTVNRSATCTNESDHYYVNRMGQSNSPLRFVTNHVRSSSPRRHPLNIPQIYVNCVSPSLSEGDHASPVRTNRMEDRRHSGESSSSDRTRSSISLEDVVGMRLLEDEADSVAKFQEYLKTRGIKLDMNSVQSSDV